MVAWSLLQVPLARGKTQHAEKNKKKGGGRSQEKRAVGYRKITKGRDLKQYIENTCHDRYDPSWRKLCSLLSELYVENQSGRDSNRSDLCHQTKLL
jgi:hypothetical protein